MFIAFYQGINSDKLHDHEMCKITIHYAFLKHLGVDGLSVFSSNAPDLLALVVCIPLPALVLFRFI
jgi:hypothetical protein